jgi:hypothetical protein
MVPGENPYQLEFVTPSGETLEEILDSWIYLKLHLPQRMGRPIKTIKGKTALHLKLLYIWTWPWILPPVSG